MGRGRVTTEYRDIALQHEVLGRKLQTLIEDLLVAKAATFHVVTYRVKKEKSAWDKISDPGNDYVELLDLHDMLGIRVIAHLNAEVDSITSLLDGAFDFDLARNSDRRRGVKNKEFGYRSVHRVGTLGEGRLALPEWAPYRGLRFEIQIRTVLQHAWAQVEHDLGYKPDSSATPPEVERRFSRLSALLEIADDEFDDLRRIMDANKTAAASAVKDGVDTGLDTDSYLELVAHSPVLLRVDRAVADAVGNVLKSEIDSQGANARVEGLLEWGMDTTQKVEEALNRYEKQLAAFAGVWVGEQPREPLYFGEPAATRRFPRGISTFYLRLWMFVLSDNGLAFEEAFSHHIDWEEDPDRADRWQRAIDAAQQAS